MDVTDLRTSGLLCVCDFVLLGASRRTWEDREENEGAGGGRRLAWLPLLLCVFLCFVQFIVFEEKGQWLGGLRFVVVWRASRWPLDAD